MRIVMGLLLATLSVVAPATRAEDAADRVLARLHRIGRGEWRTPRSAAPRVRFAPEIARAARGHGLSVSLLTALVRVESAFDPYAVSSAGAQGLGQLMPQTARALGVRNAFDPVQNLDGSARYLARQLARFGDLRLALGAYHAGPGRAARGYAALPSESRRYVERVLRFEREYRDEPEDRGSRRRVP